MNMEYTPENITSLDEDEVFVFGSNLAGMHTGGAARVAYEAFRSRDGAGASACRDSRMPSLPCKGSRDDKTIRRRLHQALPANGIRTTFYVTRIRMRHSGIPG